MMVLRYRADLVVGLDINREYLSGAEFAERV